MRLSELLNEVEYDPDYPIQDGAGDHDLKADYAKWLPKLKHVTTLGEVEVMATSWPASTTGTFFLVRDDEPLGIFEFIGNNTMCIPYTYVTKKARRQGLGFALYAFLLKQGYTIESGRSHTADSRAMWSKLARTYGVMAGGKEYRENLPYGDYQGRFKVALSESWAPPVILYHGTYRSNIEAIKREGLDPSKSQSSLDAVFLAIDEHTARQYDHHHAGIRDEWVILGINTVNLDLDLMGPDNYELPEMLHHNDDDREWDEVSWDDSLNICGQCAYHGVIPPTSILF